MKNKVRSRLRSKRTRMQQQQPLVYLILFLILINQTQSIEGGNSYFDNEIEYDDDDYDKNNNNNNNEDLNVVLSFQQQQQQLLENYSTTRNSSTTIDADSESSSNNSNYTKSNFNLNIKKTISISASINSNNNDNTKSLRLRKLNDHNNNNTNNDTPTIWWVLKVVSMIGHGSVVLFQLIFLWAIISNQVVRNVSHNIYLIFLVIPDMMVNLMFLVVEGTVVPITTTADRATLNFLLGPHATFGIILWCTSFYYLTNFWLNSRMAQELYNVMIKSYRRIRVPPSSLKKVFFHCFCIYFLAAVVATWGVLPVSWSWIHTHMKDGVLIFGSLSSPEEADSSKSSNEVDVVFNSNTRDQGENQCRTRISILIYLGITLIPTCHVLYIRYLMWKKKLFTPKIYSSSRSLMEVGRRTGQNRVRGTHRNPARSLSLYYMRIIISFFVFYYPNIIILIVKMAAIEKMSSKVWFCLTVVNKLLFILQGLTTVCMATKKDDVGMAVKTMATSIRDNLRSCTSFLFFPSSPFFPTAFYHHQNENDSTSSHDLKEEETEEIILFSSALSMGISAPIEDGRCSIISTIKFDDDNNHIYEGTDNNNNSSTNNDDVHSINGRRRSSILTNGRRRSSILGKEVEEMIWELYGNDDISDSDSDDEERQQQQQQQQQSRNTTIDNNTIPCSAEESSTSTTTTTDRDLNWNTLHEITTDQPTD